MERWKVEVRRGDMLVIGIDTGVRQCEKLMKTSIKRRGFGGREKRET
jgi:hypothetical protein